jgi:hypothetical protein
MAAITAQTVAATFKGIKMAWYDDILDPSQWTAQGVGAAASGLGLLGSLTGNKSAPAAPDYAGLAAADTASNRTDQITPYGSSTWAVDPKNPNHWTNTQALSAPQQALLDQSNKLKSNQGNLALGLSGRLGTTLGGAMPGVYDPTQATNTATEQLMARINPMLDRQGNQLNTQLANQGITQGSEAWKNAQDDFGKQRNDAYSQASLQGINLGQTQQAQQYSQGMTNRNQPLNELNALQNGSQVTNPSFSSGPTASSQVTAGQNTYNANLGATNAANAANNNTSQGLFGLGTTLFNSK